MWSNLSIFRIQRPGQIEFTGEFHNMHQMLKTSCLDHDMPYVPLCRCLFFNIYYSFSSSPQGTQAYLEGSTFKILRNDKTLKTSWSFWQRVIRSSTQVLLSRVQLSPSFYAIFHPAFTIYSQLSARFRFIVLTSHWARLASSQHYILGGVGEEPQWNSPFSIDDVNWSLSCQAATLYLFPITQSPNVRSNEAKCTQHMFNASCTNGPLSAWPLPIGAKFSCKDMTMWQIGASNPIHIYSLSRSNGVAYFKAAGNTPTPHFWKPPKF